MATQMTLEQAKEHIQIPLTADMTKYAREVVFKDCRYIFTWRVGKKQYGYCTYCRGEYETTRLKHNVSESAGLKHNREIVCPVCGYTCKVKSSKMPRKSLIDEAYFVYYRKSMIDPRALTAIGIYAVQDLSGEYKGAEIQYIDTSLYVFLPGSGGFAFHRPLSADDYCQAKTVKCQYNRGRNQFIDCCYARESLPAAVAGTPFRWSTWEQYNIADMVEFFDLFARYPCVEYLTKLGFRRLVQDKLEVGRTYGALNWRGKTLLKVLRLTKQEVSRIKECGLEVDCRVLWVLRLSRKEGANFTIEEAAKVRNAFDDYDLEQLLNRFKQYASLRTLTSYFIRQAERVQEATGKPAYFRADSAFMAWKDYLADCVALGIDLSKGLAVFPRNLYTAHQKTIKLVRYKTDQLLNQRIKDRLKDLSSMFFSQDGLFIRAAQSTDELIAEGTALEHCVGRYADRYAKGATNLFLIRRLSEPDKPFFTLEAHDDRVIQCSGLKNCSPTPEVKAFLSAFEAAKLTEPKSKKMGVAM